jgi:hypothetical protein
MLSFVDSRVLPSRPVFNLQERALPGRAAKLAATCVLRFSNTYLGSAMWVAWARLAGLQ